MIYETKNFKINGDVLSKNSLKNKKRSNKKKDRRIKRVQTPIKQNLNLKQEDKKWKEQPTKVEFLYLFF
jgi:hypothetical protein